MKHTHLVKGLDYVLKQKVSCGMCTMGHSDLFLHVRVCLTHQKVESIAAEKKESEESKKLQQKKEKDRCELCVVCVVGVGVGGWVVWCGVVWCSYLTISMSLLSEANF